ncbi:hypothetical protein COX86_03005 [Candidatus Micrarchaeota archaeon CG_4_10_14_0_2_um_filter_60_11]|nr:MAG: hypothetical protein AUJ16_00930 [Candidatus Micrarchaeota archaeon CG1_02_60_51]PIN96096.1 MAG: hypothetical protein COU39_02760 [Candidatus Micrarchaeota archaeon CG10_big_fil_rev_8_21_14_0_10_60_32]PIO01602.1 MAG: hypothetical protein COT58_04380 [Candidatus Micrarchaeota archaeon CG09_land_8_20_14_0_10_60_16]PIY91731.1 MAG: hypothetical protein COY71_01675 [Candidatus Micrarchaeota archaeon CG_4_10_14_0_8_um_filter_60_7]PIZ90814.1 MAG: hypothetical protein COX86_03005 [Candidatus Mi
MFSFTKSGVHLCGEEEVGLDCRHENVFISHAHADHAFSSKKSKRVMASDATLDLLKTRGFSLAGERWNNGFQLLRAGHVLGALQLRAELDGCVCTYAPDFKLSDSLTVKGAEMRSCDDLVVDGTFASPEFVFPPRETVYDQIGKWAKANEAAGVITVFGGYALGKAQELVACLNEYAAITPLVSGETAELCRAYLRHGIPLDFLAAESDEGRAALKGAFTAVLPMNRVGRPLASRLKQFYGRKVRTAVATGWALCRPFATDGQFALSDHADSLELKKFVEGTGAKRVYSEKGARLA